MLTKYIEKSFPLRLPCPLKPLLSLGGVQPSVLTLCFPQGSQRVPNGVNVKQSQAVTRLLGSSWAVS